MTEINITGNVPSKKNLLKLTRGGRGYYDSETKATLNDLSEQVTRQWCKTTLDGHRVPRSPLIHPAIAVVFYVVSERSDKDNKYTTILDSLVSGGVLKDDCIAYCNGPVLLCEAVKTPSVAGAKIFIEESGDFEKLWRVVKSRDTSDYQWLKDFRDQHSATKSKRLKRVGRNYAD